MADDNDELLLVDEIEDDLDLGEGQAAEEGGEDRDDGEIEEVGFADEHETAAPEHDLVKHLRQQIRDRDKRLAEVAKAAPAEEPIIVGPKPTIESCEWDAERFEVERDAWDDRKAAADRQVTKREEMKRAQEQQWSRYTQDYEAKKAALRYPDAREAEQAAIDTLSPTAQALIVRHADNSALFLYAVGKSPAKLAELARIDAEGDPFAVVKAVTKMEATLTTKRSGARPPNPDTPLRGKPIASGGADKQLDKLRESAAKTGDRSAIAAYLKGKK